MTENEEMLQSLPGTIASIDTAFHAVYIPQENEEPQEVNSKESVRVYQDKVEALRVIKEFKTGRLKTFKSRSEAEEYANTGFEKTNSANNQASSVPPIEEKANNFKGPKTQDLLRFRKLIESGDLDAVRTTAWGNPRYLISSGDTPAILQEGSRYNALHIAVKTGKPDMCQLILNTIGNAEFIKLLYGEEDCKSYLDRTEIMLDLYLNTPDKGLNETPLHFAVKFGLKEIVRVLVLYPQCEKRLRNKYQQMPIDIICNRKCQDDEELKKEIRMLLEDQYYVPVLRAEDNSLQPVIGEPFSPVSPLSFNTDPISPRLEVRAFAGPMSKSQALDFRKKWKTPPRHQLTPLKRTPDKESDMRFLKRTLNNECGFGSPISSVSLRLQDAEKGLERVGRDLAEEYQVSWKEYWPFLNDFVDFRTAEGLAKLEKYLEQKFQDRLFYCNRSIKKPINSEIKVEAIDEIDRLCDKFQSCSLLGRSDSEETNIDDSEFFTPPSSPKLVAENSDDEMQLAEEGPLTFLEGCTPTKVDYAVLNALLTSIDSSKHPNIYRWRHDIKLTMDREPQRTKDTPRRPRRKLIMDM